MQFRYIIILNPLIYPGEGPAPIYSAIDNRENYFRSLTNWVKIVFYSFILKHLTAMNLSSSLALYTFA